MATADRKAESAYFILTAWCTVAKAWHEIPGRHGSVQDAERMATERGIYRVTYFCEGRRCDLEPFALVGDG